MIAPTLTRGERANNPGNINFDAHVDWLGQIGIELPPPGEKARFARFDTPEHGIRALVKVLRAYIERDGCKTMQQMIWRWAPAKDANNTIAYVANVCTDTGFAPNYRPESPSDFASLATAIIHHENGRVIYDPALIAKATADAFA